MKRATLTVLLVGISLSACCSDYTLKGRSYDRKAYFSLFQKQIEVQGEKQEEMPGYLAIRIYNQRYLPTLSQEKSSENVGQ